MLIPLLGIGIHEIELGLRAGSVITYRGPIPPQFEAHPQHQGRAMWSCEYCTNRWAPDAAICETCGAGRTE